MIDVMNNARAPPGAFLAVKRHRHGSKPGSSASQQNTLHSLGHIKRHAGDNQQKHAKQHPWLALTPLSSSRDNI
jgi:hypothetical protein